MRESVSNDRLTALLAVICRLVDLYRGRLVHPQVRLAHYGVDLVSDAFLGEVVERDLRDLKSLVHLELPGEEAIEALVDEGLEKYFVVQ